MLQFDKGTDFAMLVRKPDSESLSLPFRKILEIDSASGEDSCKQSGFPDQCDTVQAHYNLFCSLYHLPLPHEHWPISIAHAYHMKLATLGKMYGCEAVVGLDIERLLGRCQDDILEDCVLEPNRNLSLAYEVKSDWIFKEAAINLVGHNNSCYEEARKRVKEAEIRELLDQKRADFVAALKACEYEMYSIQPRKDGGVMSYMAVSLFQLWLSETINQKDYGSGLNPGYANLYHTIRLKKITLTTLTRRKVGQKYLDRLIGDFDEQDTKRLETQLSVVVSEAAEILQPILYDARRRGKGKDDEFRDLTFTKISDNELPWSKT